MSAASFPALPKEIFAFPRIQRNSARVQPGDAFVTWAQGADRDAYCREAIQRGAQALICEPPLPQGINLPLIAVENARYAYALMSCALHHIPPLPPLIGVTGTDGKTSVVHSAWHCLGAGAARVGSLGMVHGTEELETGHTSPPSEVLHPFLASLPIHCPGVALEISSHAAHQYRFAGLPLRALAFTGLGRDHLDYHGTMRAYLDAKLQAADLLAPGSWLLVNADDAHSVDFIERVQDRTSAIIELGCVRGDALLRRHPQGWRLLFAGRNIALPITTQAPHLAWNAAAGALLAHACGQDLELAVERLRDCPAVPGRMELLAENPASYVDYACTPDAIRRCIASLRMQHPGQRLVVVVGCGGDRDRGKRGPMGLAAAAADQVILTNDNPRREDPQQIIRDMLVGVGMVQRRRMEIILDRAQAIDRARQQAGPAGVVAVLGKGHERVQIIGSEHRPWSDRDYLLGLTPAPLRPVRKVKV